MKIKIGDKEFDVEDDQILDKDGKVNGEVSLDSDLVMRTPDEDASFKENSKQEGIQAGADIGRKEVLKGLGMEINGQHKNDASAIDAIKTWHSDGVTAKLEEAGTAPDAKVKELTTDIETLKGTISGLETERDNAVNGLTTFKTTQTKRTEIKKHLPENLIISKDKALKLMEGDLNVDVAEGGGLVVKDAQGNIRKDTKSLDPIGVNVAVKEWFNDNPDLLKKSAGGGGGDGGDSEGEDGKQSLERFTEEMVDKGITPNSVEFNAEMKKRMEAGTLTV